MKRLLSQTFAIAAVGVTAMAFTPACADNDQSIFVRAALYPPQNRQNGSCVYTADPTQTMLFEGTLDTALSETYYAVLLVGNQLIQRGDPTVVRAESNRAHINGAVVRVTDANGGAIAEFSSLASSFVEPQLNNTPGFAPVGIQALDATTTRSIIAGGIAPFGGSRRVVANIKVFGKTTGGVDLESGEFQFPIAVCNGCLVDFSTGDDPAKAGLDCTLPLGGASGGTTTQVLPCRAGQDESLACQYCISDERPLCARP